MLRSYFAEFLPMPIKLVIADITQLQVDAIVNAASPALLGGGGVDGAIHRAAGPHLLDACRGIPEVAPGVRCPTGEVRLTPGFDLPARWVIHTVGPIWRGGAEGEPALLARCYRRAVELARTRDWCSVVFPAISCGVYGYPPAAAARVAVDTLRDALARDDRLEVTLCCFNAAMHAVFARALSEG